jgi:hypothetical protein
MVNLDELITHPFTLSNMQEKIIEFKNDKKFGIKAAMING